MCEINAWNVTGSSGAEARVGAEERGGRPLCDPDAESLFHVRMRGLEPAAAAPRQRPAPLRLPLEVGGLEASPLNCKASLSSMHKIRPGEQRCAG